MGELGAVRRYLYWSDRLVRETAEHNRVDLGRKSMAFQLSIKFFQATQSGSGRSLFSDEIADRLLRTLGDTAVSDFVTPPPVQFARGAGHMQFGESSHGRGKRNTATLHTRVISSDGQQTDVCLFGGMHNYIGFRQADRSEEGWASSAWPWIEQLLASRGRECTWDEDGDFESIAVEAVKIMREEGFDEHVDLQRDLPATRAFTLGHDDDVEWLAVIYRDVVLTKERWNWHSNDDPLDRVLIGAPLWVRSVSPSATTFYTTAIRKQGFRQLEQRQLETQRTRRKLPAAHARSRNER